MKRLLIIACLGVVAWGGYEWLNDFMQSERIGSAIEAAIDDPRTRSVDAIRSEIHDAVRLEGIEFDPSTIEIGFASDSRQPLAGQLVAGAGLATTSERITVRVTYEHRVWGQLRSRTVVRSRVFIASATPPPSPGHSMEGLVDRARNVQDRVNQRR